jgi:hypothetical protein
MLYYDKNEKAKENEKNWRRGKAYLLKKNDDVEVRQSGKLNSFHFVYFFSLKATV